MFGMGTGVTLWKVPPRHYHLSDRPKFANFFVAGPLLALAVGFTYASGSHPRVSNFANLVGPYRTNIVEKNTSDVCRRKIFGYEARGRFFRGVVNTTVRKNRGPATK